MHHTRTSVETDALWLALRERNSQSARQSLVESYAGLVRYVAGRLAAGLPHHLEFPDLYAAGLVGLIQAIDHFDSTRGIKFETYAVPRIRGAILDELRAQDWFPRSVRRRARDLEAGYQALERQNGRAPSDEEVAAHLGLSMEEFDRLLSQVSLATIVSLESEMHADDGAETPRFMDTLVDESSDQPEEQLARRESRELVVRALEDLNERERLVLVLYYYEELTLREIGEILDVTESRVCQIHTKAIFRLRGKIERLFSARPLKQLGAEVAEALKQRVGS
jgi:RNA polymerase sigma factor for flagellar operon FliA